MLSLLMPGILALITYSFSRSETSIGIILLASDCSSLKALLRKSSNREDIIGNRSLLVLVVKKVILASFLAFYEIVISFFGFISRFGILIVKTPSSNLALILSRSTGT